MKPLSDRIKVLPVHPWNPDSKWKVLHYNGPGRGWLEHRDDENIAMRWDSKGAAVSYLIAKDLLPVLGDAR